MKNRKFESYILKNRIPGIILSLIMVGCMIIMAWHFSLPDRIRSRTYRSIADIESRANPNDRDVTITVDRADYIGYDYYVDSERQAGTTTVSRMADMPSCSSGVTKMYC